MLGALREMEGRYRLPSPCAEEKEEEESVEGDREEDVTLGLSPSLSRSSESEEGASTSSASPVITGRVVAYRTDVTIDHLTSESDVVAQFVELVNGLLLPRSTASRLPSRSSGGRASAPVSQEEEEHKTGTLTPSGSVEFGLGGLGETRVPRVMTPQSRRKEEGTAAARSAVESEGEEEEEEDEDDEDEEALPLWAQEGGFPTPLGSSPLPFSLLFSRSPS